MHEPPSSDPGNNKGVSPELKKIIMKQARKGAFDHNPLLNTTHFVTCQQCKHSQHIVYLNYLRSGAFEFGNSEQIEVLTSQGPVGFLEMERVTMITISFACEKCGNQIEVRPVSVEYIQVILDKPTTSGTMYV